MIAELESRVGGEAELLAPRLHPRRRGPSRRRGGGWDVVDDVDLLAVVRAPEIRHPLEVRIFPGSDDAAEVVRRAAPVEGLPLHRRAGGALPPPSGSLTEDVAALRRRGMGRW
jgi:hypothetical protein